MPINQPIPPQFIKAENFPADISGFFRNFDWPASLYYFQAVMEILTVVLGIIFFMVLIKIRGLIKEQLARLVVEIIPPAEAVSGYDIRWTEIKNHVSSFSEAEWKLAVIEADKFVDDALKSGGYPGESMGERLMLIQTGQLLSLQVLWDAHKLRNLLVHDAKYQLTHRQAVLAIQAFEETLRELGALS